MEVLSENRCKIKLVGDNMLKIMIMHKIVNDNNGGRTCQLD